MKLLTVEAESEAMRRFIWSDEDRSFAASWLLHTELHCAAGRRRAIPLEWVTGALAMTALSELTRGDLIAAAGNAPLRANGAIHLAVASRLGADEIVTYDVEFADAAERVGIRPISPGR